MPAVRGQRSGVLII